LHSSVKVQHSQSCVETSWLQRGALSLEVDALGVSWGIVIHQAMLNELGNMPLWFRDKEGSCDTLPKGNEQDKQHCTCTTCVCKQSGFCHTAALHHQCAWLDVQKYEEAHLEEAQHRGQKANVGVCFWWLAVQAVASRDQILAFEKVLLGLQQRQQSLIMGLLVPYS